MESLATEGTHQLTCAFAAVELLGSTLARETANAVVERTGDLVRAFQEIAEKTFQTVTADRSKWAEVDFAVLESELDDHRARLDDAEQSFLKVAREELGVPARGEHSCRKWR
jgi:hypothetical protein